MNLTRVNAVERHTFLVHFVNLTKLAMLGRREPFCDALQIDDWLLVPAGHASRRAQLRLVLVGSHLRMRDGQRGHLVFVEDGFSLLQVRSVPPAQRRLMVQVDASVERHDLARATSA